MGVVDPDDLDIRYAEEDSGLAWGVEIELAFENGKSKFFSARKVVLDGTCAQVQLLDGTYETFPIDSVRKVMAMKASLPREFADEDTIADELY